MNAGSRMMAFVRIATGVLFIAEGVGKITGKFVHGGFARNAESMLKESWPFWAAFLRSVVLPHASAFGWIVALTELAVGLGLLVGFLTRIAAGGGAAFLLTILLGQSYVPGSSGEGWITAGLTTKFALLLLLALWAGDAGRTWGVDARRKRGIRPGFR